MNLTLIGSCYSLGLGVACIKIASGETVYYLRILHPLSNTRRRRCLPDAVSFYSSSFQNESCAQSVRKCRETTTTLSRVRKSLPILMKCHGDVVGNWDCSSSNGAIRRWQQDSIGEKNRSLERLCRVRRGSEKLPNKKIDSCLEDFENLWR